MASQQTRAWLASQESYYLCPLPQVQLAEGELEAALRHLSEARLRSARCIESPTTASRAECRRL